MKLTKMTLALLLALAVGGVSMIPIGQAHAAGKVWNENYGGGAG